MITHLRQALVHVSAFTALLVCAALVVGLANARVLALAVGQGQPRLDANMARIYIFRDESHEAGVTTDVELDSGLTARLGPLTYVSFDVKPGRHTIRSGSSGPDSIDIDLAAGTTTYVWQQMKMGALWGQARLHIVDQVSGSAKIGIGRAVFAK